MSDPRDVSRPRTPLNLSPKIPRPATPFDEMASRMYGGASTPHSAVALARASREGVVDPSKGAPPHSALAAAPRGDTPPLSSESLYDLGSLTEPTAGPGMAMLGLGGGMRPPNEVLGLGATQVPDFGDPSDKYRRFTLKRDRDRPLAFDGRIRAEAEEKQFGGQVVIRAAIYETQGGKFVTEMTRREIDPPVSYGVGKRPFLFAKAAVFENLDLAAMSFRTHGGRLTEQLLRQIGDVDSEFIE